jgi:hypothetical protein
VDLAGAFEQIEKWQAVKFLEFGKGHEDAGWRKR